MTAQSDLSRRVDASAGIADYVYDFEKKYTDRLKKDASDKNAKKDAIRKIKKDLNDLNLTLVDSMYDRKTGIAAIAVRDNVTGETYVSYAGTNFDADGLKDGISDVAIGLNDPLYLKQLGDVAVSFYDRVQRTGANITVSTGHSYSICRLIA